jgi:peptidoglycan/LPS O-acetylase OafA/YrhL
VILGLLVFLPCAWTMHQAEQSYKLQNTGEALGIALLFAAVVLPDPTRERIPRPVRLLESRALVAVGVVSYSLFLWHDPIIFWLRAHGLTMGGWDGILVNLLVTSVIAGALSTLTYRFVERPALKRKRSTRIAIIPPSRTPAPTDRGLGNPNGESMVTAGLG